MPAGQREQQVAAATVLTTEGFQGTGAITGPCSGQRVVQPVRHTKGRVSRRAIPIGADINSKLVNAGPHSASAGRVVRRSHSVTRRAVSRKKMILDRSQRQLLDEWSRVFSHHTPDERVLRCLADEDLGELSRIVSKGSVPRELPDDLFGVAGEAIPCLNDTLFLWLFPLILGLLAEDTVSSVIHRFELISEPWTAGKEQNPLMMLSPSVRSVVFRLCVQYIRSCWSLPSQFPRQKQHVERCRKILCPST